MNYSLFVSSDVVYYWPLLLMRSNIEYRFFECELPLRHVVNKIRTCDRILLPPIKFSFRFPKKIFTVFHIHRVSSEAFPTYSPFLVCLMP